MSITSKTFGTLKNGQPVTAYTLTAECGVSVTVLDLGGIINSVMMPDRNGKLKDIVCGYDTPEEYLSNDGYSGAIIGRYANRIKNGTFTLNGKEYHIPKNEKGKNALHGGKFGFDKKLWNAEAGKCSCGADRLTLTCISEDGEEGFPGKLDVKVVYRLTSDGELAIRYFAKADKETPIAMTNHAYFNLAGYDTQNVLDQILKVNADKIVAVDDELIPTAPMDVTGTAFDFRKGKAIGLDIDKDDEQLKTVGGGYDHTFIISSEKKLDFNHGLKLTEAAVLTDRSSGRQLTLYTDAPGLQVYSGNFMGGNLFKGGVPSRKHGAICLETGFYPDSPNRPDFPCCIFGPDRDYQCTAVFKFETVK